MSTPPPPPSATGQSPVDTATVDQDSAAKTDPPSTEKIVLEYLRSKGLYQAALEVNRRIQQESKDKETEQQEKSATNTVRDRLEQEDEESRAQRSLLTRSTGGGYGYERDDIWHIVKWGVGDSNDQGKEETKDAKMIGSVDAETFIDAFVALQLWILTLPDHDGAQTVDDPIARARALMEADGDQASLEAVIQEVSKTTSAHVGKQGINTVQYNLPPSAKSELLAVTFALLVYTYCELLEVGMDSVAHQLRDAFKTLYEPFYPEEFLDLYKCTSNEDMARLNTLNNQHMEAIAQLKAILVEVAKHQLRREEHRTQQSLNGATEASELKIREYDRNINILKSRYAEMGERASRVFAKMNDWPFLRRARAARWHLTLSSQSYGLLTAFLGKRDNSLLPMSTLLHTRCTIVVEQRDPLPYIPACVLEEKINYKLKDEKAPSIHSVNKEMVRWAAPAVNAEKHETDERLPYPKYDLDEEYENEDEAKEDKRIVEFNRSLLTKGFRRLEALERKRTYDSLSPLAQKRLREDESNVELADPLTNASILLTTLCASTSGPILKSNALSSDVASIWEEPGVGLCCAKLCPPDGRRVAVGCDDAAVRVWAVNDSVSPAEPSQVLLGHKNGFPVFDVDWNRDGQTLLSAGGDGSIRLWDTMTEGPFGELAKPKSSKISSITPSKAKAGETLAALKESIKEDTREPDMTVEGFKAQTSPYTSGAALAVYRGHVPSTPVWSVAFSPTGYYFASAGGDGTARLWATDIPTPVRLFTGHTSANVNCISWHPNANYVVTGSDDKTVRLWDIQSGRTVRLLTGCTGAVHHVKISPGGRYVAGADQMGIVHMWDLSSGKKMNEFRSPHRPHVQDPRDSCMLHSLAFSPCGTALATGGDDATVRIWDVRRETLTNEAFNAFNHPHKAFPTRQTMLLDLQYSSRNLLMGVGKYLTPIPLSQRKKS